MGLCGINKYQNLMKASLKSTMKIGMQDIFLKQMWSIQKKKLVFIKIYHFYQKEENQKKQKNSFVVQKTKKNMSFTRALKQALNNGLKLKKVHRVIKFR